MRRLLSFLLLLIPFAVDAQFIVRGNYIPRTTTQEYVTNSPTNAPDNRRVVIDMKDSTHWYFMFDSARLDILNNTKSRRNDLRTTIVADNNGFIYPASFDVLLDTSATIASKTWVLTRNFLTSQLNADWNAVSGASQILNKPTLAAVATSGAYTDLSGRPTLATVATTGAYSDLTGRPTIPAAQVNADWNSVSGVSQILNKPTLATVATTGAYTDLSGRPTLATVATTGAYSDLTGRPTIPAAQVNADWNAVSGVSQILNKPTINSGTVTSVGVSSTDLAVSGSPVTGSGTITVNLNTSGVSAGTYDLVTVNTKGVVTAGTNSSGLTSVTRPVNSTTYTISSTRPSRAYYYIRISCSASIGSNAAGSVSLQYSVDGGTNWLFAGQVSNSNQVTLAVALNSITEQTGLLEWEFPANALIRMVSATSGTTTITYVGGGERTL